MQLEKRRARETSIVWIYSRAINNFHFIDSLVYIRELREGGGGGRVESVHKNWRAKQRAHTRVEMVRMLIISIYSKRIKKKLHYFTVFFRFCM